MRRPRVVGSVLSTLLLTASACATAGSAASLQPTGSNEPTSDRVDARTVRDSAVAQQIADARGPAVAIHASYETFGGMRRVQSWFRADQDAYVIVGHLGEDGVVRIVFPQPGDDGFVTGGHTYYLPRIFAGFLDSYRSRFAMNRGYAGLSPARNASYDGGMGYLFAIASWRPMHTEKMQDAGGWATWELSDDEYFRDPRPAIYELASLLAGENREAYTVQFARYFGTASYATLASFNLGYNAFWPYGSSFAAGWCSGFEPIGYFFGLPYFPWARSGMLYSGLGYTYDAGLNCYRGTFGTPIYQTATQPFLPTTPTAKPVWSAPTNPGVKRPPDATGEALQSRIAAPTKSAGDVTAQYRQRGLFMADNDARPTTPRTRTFGGNNLGGERPGHGVNRPMSMPPANDARRDDGGRTRPTPTPRAWSRPGSAGSPGYDPRPSMPSGSREPSSAGSSGAAPIPSAPTGAAHTSGSSGSEPMASPRGSKPPQR